MTHEIVLSDMRRRLQHGAIAALLGMTCGLAGAQATRAQPVGFTWGELALLPDYCRDTNGTVYLIGDQSPRAAQWIALMGDDFWHMHHYCYGLRDLMHAEQAGLTPQQRREVLEGAIKQFNYIVNNARPTMVLMPEVYLKIGQTYVQLGNISAASNAFEVSRRLKADYWPAYTAWIDELLKLHKTGDAKKLAMEGLTYAPDSAELLARLKRIDPNAHAPAAAAPAAAAAAIAPGANPGADDPTAAPRASSAMPAASAAAGAPL